MSHGRRNHCRIDAGQQDSRFLGGVESCWAQAARRGDTLFRAPLSETMSCKSCKS
jgi:hypothetical protein